MTAMNKQKALTAAEVRELFIVEPETGHIFWRVGHTAGQRAGTVLASGYRKIGQRIDGKFVQYYAHHIVWTWAKGKRPSGGLDHVNGNKDDNRLRNLRRASARQNRVNRCRAINNKSGRKWVCLHKSSVEKGSPRPWQAAVWFGKTRKQKYFSDPDVAYQWAEQVAQKLHGPFYNPGVP